MKGAEVFLQISCDLQSPQLHGKSTLLLQGSFGMFRLKGEAGERSAMSTEPSIKGNHKAYSHSFYKYQHLFYIVEGTCAEI